MTDTSLLDEAELEKLRKQARSEFEADQRKEQMKSFLDSEKKRLRDKADPEKELITMYLDLPAYCDRITIDGVHYIHGGTYEFTPKKYATIKEMVYKAWQHQIQVENGGNKPTKPRGLVLSGREGAMRGGADYIRTTR